MFSSSTKKLFLWKHEFIAHFHNYVNIATSLSLLFKNKFYYPPFYYTSWILQFTGCLDKSLSHEKYTGPVQSYEAQRNIPFFLNTLQSTTEYTLLGRFVFDCTVDLLDPTTIYLSILGRLHCRSTRPHSYLSIYLY